MLTWTLPAEAWPTLSAQLELADGPWPESLALLDLDWHRAELAAKRLSRMPGRATLAARWGWTEHKARVFLEASRDRRSPALHQLETAPAPGKPHHDPIGGTGTASSATRSSPQVALEASQELGRVAPATSPAPGAHQDPASPTAENAPPTVTDHQRDTRTAANGGSENPPHTPPDLSIPDPDPDPERQIQGGQGGGPDLSLVPSELRAQAEASPEVRVFLRVFLRWKAHPKAPHRWRTGTSEALSWFLETFMAADPATPVGKAVAALDLAGSIEAWDAWLSDRVDEHGTPGTKGRSKFPRGWKNALRRWILNQHKYRRNLKPQAQRRRGAWGGRPTSFTPAPRPTPAPLTTTPGPDQARPANPCTPPGDHDALERF